MSANTKQTLTLPTDSKERKEYPLLNGCLKYFPAALAGIARISKEGNDKHNPGLPLHHARGLSMDHGDCVIRHLIDTEDLLAALSRADANEEPALQNQILTEASQMAWRALAYSQMLHEKFGAPLAPGADERLLKPVSNSAAPRAELAETETSFRELVARYSSEDHKQSVSYDDFVAQDANEAMSVALVQSVKQGFKIP